MTAARSWGGDGGDWSVIVHGGAGEVAPERRDATAAGCRAAAEGGAEILARGGSALDAVQRAVEILESDPQFNAGTGACLDRSGHLSLDAAIMEGSELHAGAVCALPAFEHPIAIARAILNEGEHVLFAAHGARAFAERVGFRPAIESDMITDAARRNLAEAIASGAPQSWAGGTVGAVARDARGTVAAATSTGGTTGKQIGRVGDTPLIGAGTFADDGAGAASATGLGEGIVRVGLTRGVIEMLRAGASPENAARASIEQMRSRVGTTGGVIVVDAKGRVGYAHTTTTMSWGAVWPGGVASGT